MKTIFYLGLLSVSSLFCFNLYAQNTMYIAHRGASYDAPENTLAAVKLAWDKNADAVEIDVHLSKDNRIMVIHDKDTKQTSGEKLVVKNTNSDELRKMDVGGFKGSDFIGEKIPFLEEVIETIPAGKKLFIEIKCGTEVLPFFKDLVDKSGKISQLVIIGFDFEVVEKAKNLIPSVPAYWLHYNVMGEYDKKWIEKAKQAGLDGLNFRFTGITSGYAKAVHKAGLKIFTWTVDDPKEAKRLIELGIDGITTNRPEWLKNQVLSGIR
ncbi:MAG: glycerophosphodiester phosphodiesterase [Bacteroidales bacterium]|nr:glycerophosphodiester phosphodiesterase [Bacteroidales bacterium]